MCTFELDTDPALAAVLRIKVARHMIQEKRLRAEHLHLQQQLKAELSNETFSLLLASGFKEVNESDPFAWDFDGVLHSRSLMFSFTTVASIGYGDMAPLTTSGQIFCIIFTLIATPGLVLTYLAAARKSLPGRLSLLISLIFSASRVSDSQLDFVYLMAMLMDERNIRIFHKYDRDDSGQLNLPEFMVALNDLGYPAREEDVRMLMEEVNICDSELISIEEFGQAMVLLEHSDAKFRKLRHTALLIFVVALIWLFVGTATFMYVESWSFVESMWFCWETSMTIGLGDLIPQTDTGRWLNVIYSFIGLGHLSLLLQSFVDMLQLHTSTLGRVEKRFVEVRSRLALGQDERAGRLTRSFSNLLSGSKKVAGQEMLGCLEAGRDEIPVEARPDSPKPPRWTGAKRAVEDLQTI
ncbi:unnamed protein product [Cladocopium goreaui]|uniref:Two pore potassium channel protein sup-9 (Suppressor of unc-93 protein 9) (N2P38) n=1 Tax=Cladocopium goreaui TaxID=2562237 RepID=A0A9P1FMC3_9DINO|nr:unnamed protein product [Cladocopium goreaui]